MAGAASKAAETESDPTHIYVGETKTWAGESDSADAKAKANSSAKALAPFAAPRTLSASPRRAASTNAGQFRSADAGNVWWSFSNGTLTLTTNGNTDKVTLAATDCANALPWKGSVSSDAVTIVTMDSTIKVKSFSNWFAGYTKLLTFTINAVGTNVFDASTIDSFESMFQGCSSLTSLTTNGWATKASANYTNLFKDCGKLSTLDLTGWTVSSGSSREGMLSGLSSIQTIVVPGTVTLDGTGFGDTATRGETAGTWSKGSAEVGSATNVVANHESTTGTTTDTYSFAYESYFASNKDKNVRWAYADNTLSIYVVDASKSTAVSEPFDKLPWLASVGSAPISTVVVRTYAGAKDATSGVAAKVTPSSLASWFASYANLQSFDGRGLDVSGVSDFGSLFQKDAYLTTVNLSGWDMRKASSLTLTYMFAGCSSLANLTLTWSVILEGTSLDNTLAGHAGAAGVWKDTATRGTWAGTTDNLVSRYPRAQDAKGINGVAGISYPTEEISYSWVGNELGGRFANDNAWWKFDKSSGTLTLGVDSTTLPRTVTEDSDHLPWRADSRGTTIVDAKLVKSIVAACATDADGKEVLSSGIAPETLASWLVAHTNLGSLDARGMDVSKTQYFTGFLKGLKSLTTLNLEGWAMGDVDRTGMFSGTKALVQVILSDGVILAESGFDDGTDFAHTTTAGSWQTDDKDWFGSSSNLASRYPASATTNGNARGTYIYVWSRGLKSGRFVSNDNAWWKFDADKGTLTIGVTLPAGTANTEAARAVTEVATTPSDGDTSKRLPWLNVLATPKDSIRSVVFSGTDGTDGSDDLRLVARNPEGWFEGYASLVGFDGTGLDVGHATDKESLASFFKGCAKLSNIGGLKGWDVSQITSLAHLFDGCSLLMAVPEIGDWKTGSVTDFSYLFHGDTALTLMTGVSKWNVTKGDTFESCFDGAKFVTDLDLSGWHMPTGATVTRMLADTGYVRNLKVSNGVRLEGTGFFDANLLNQTREPQLGSWKRTDGGEADPWFGTTANVVARYPQGGGKVRNADGTVTTDGTQTYAWQDSVLCGRFPSNDNAWWQYDTTTKVLTIGTTFSDGKYDTNTTVSETTYAEYVTATGATLPEGTSEQPWLPVIEEGNARKTVSQVVFKAGSKLIATNIYRWLYHYEAATTIDVSGLVLPSAEAALMGGRMLEGLFEGCYQLQTIKGLDQLSVSQVTSLYRTFADCTSLGTVEGMDGWVTSSLTSLAQAFMGDTSLQTLTSVATWDTSKVTDYSRAFEGDGRLTTLDLTNWNMGASVEAEDGATHSRADMVKGASSLASLTVGPNAILEGTGLDELGSRVATAGSWDASDKVWFGSTANLVTRYPKTKLAGIGGLADVPYPTGDLTYTWSDKLCGRFANDNAWWTFASGTLTIGADGGTNKLITETEDPTSRSMPWLAVIGGEAKVTKVATQANDTFQAKDPTGWFAGYSKLATFDGQGLDTYNLTSLAGMFKNCSALTTVQGLGGWNVTKVESLADFLNGATKLTTLSGTEQWTTSSLTDLTRAFANDSLLAKLKTVASWDTSQVTSFVGTFQNDYSLGELDLTNWNMLTSDAGGRTNMFTGARGLAKLTLGTQAILADTGFGNGLTYSSTYGPRLRARDGSWTTGANGWFGSTSNLAERYPVDKTTTVNGVAGATLPTSTLTYTWSAGTLAGRFHNHNAWWTYDSGTLTLGTDSGDNKVVIEKAAALPWSAGLYASEADAIPALYQNGYAAIKAIDTQGKLAPDTLEGWFKGYTKLASFDGTGLDVGATTSFKEAFANDSALASADLSNWEMGEDKDRSGLLSGCTKLGDSSGTGLKLGQGVVLTGAGLDALYTRQPTQGRWLLSEDGAEVWFDSSAELEKRYGTSTVVTSRYGVGATRPEGTHTYMWDATTLGGRFHSNQAAWWTFKPSSSSASVASTSTTGTLTLGSDGTGDIEVTEHCLGEGTDDQLPWWTPLGGKTHLDRVTKVEGSGRVAPTSLEGWFKGMTALASFSGAGLSTSHATTMAGLFENCYKLSSLTNINWDTSQVTDFSKAFYNNASLASIDLSRWNVSAGMHFDSMFALDDTHKDSTTAPSSIYLASETGHWDLLANAGKDGFTFKGMFDNLRYLKTLKVYDTMVLAIYSGLKSTGAAKQSSGLDTLMYYHTASDGSWALTSDRDVLAANNDQIVGNSDNLAARYNSDPDGTEGEPTFLTATYYWVSGFIKGSFNSNPAVWWIYDKDETTHEGTIKVGVTGKPTSTLVTEYGDGLPWVTSGLVTNPNPTNVTAEGATPVNHFVSSVEAGTIQPQSLEEWFKGYTLLTDFSGAGLDLSQTTSMKGLFEGDYRLATVSDLGTAGGTTPALTSLERTFYNTSLSTLTDITTWDTSGVTSFAELFAPNTSATTKGTVTLPSLDLSSWSMAGVANDTSKVKDMLAKLSTLRSLTLSDSIILANTGLANSLAGLSQYDGMWATLDEHGNRLWFDTTDKLAYLYDPANAHRVGGTSPTQGLAGTLTYTWDSSHLGGRFPSNANAWWLYTKVASTGDAKGTLALGADGGASGEKRVYESAASGLSDGTTSWGTLPWRSVVLTGGSTGTYNPVAITKVTTTGHLAPANLEAWFKGHAALASFDGAGLDTQHVTSMASLFEGCSILTSLTGTKDWKTPALTSLASALKGASAVKTLETFSGWDTSHVGDFSSMFEGASSLEYATGISGWDTTAAKSFKAMFKNARSLKSLNFSGWDMTTVGRQVGVTLASDYADQMMFGCTSLATVELGDKFGAGDATNGTAAGTARGTAPHQAAPTKALSFNCGAYQDSNTGLGYGDFYFYAPESTYLTITFSPNTWVYQCGGWWYHSNHQDVLYVNNGTSTSSYTADGADNVAITSTTGLVHLWIGRQGSHDGTGYLYATLTSDAPIYQLEGSSTAAGTIHTGTRSSGYWTRASDGWLGSWAELMDCYDERGGASMAGTYTWSAGSFGGRFDSNLNAWWTYKEGTLSLFGNGDARQSVVTETAKTSLLADADKAEGTQVVPFEFLRAWPTSSTAIQTYVKSITTSGSLAPTHIASWFEAYPLLTTFEGSGLDTSQATSFRHLLANDTKLTSATGMGEWDSSQVTSFEGTFTNDTALTTIGGLSGWKTGSGTTFASLFKNVPGLTSLDDLQDWDMTNATNLASMFQNTRVTALDRIAGWTTAGVTSYQYMFADNPALTSARAIGATGTGWSLSAQADLTGLFLHDYALEEVDLSQWDLRGRTIANLLAVNPASGTTAVALKTIYLAYDPDKNHVSVLTGTGLADSLNGRDIPDGVWQREDGAWYDCTDKFALLYPASGAARFAGTWAYVWNKVPGGRLTKTRTVTTTDGTATTTDVDNDYVYWQFITTGTAGGHPTGTLNIAVTSSAPADADLTVINTADELPWQSLISSGVRITTVAFNGNVKLVNPQRWFKGYTYLTTFDGSGIDFSGVGNDYVVKGTGVTGNSDHSLEALLKGCTSLTTVKGVDRWLEDTAHVTSLKDLFAGDVSLSTIDGIRRWDVGQVTNMEGLFQGAHSLADLTFLLNWDVSKVTSFDYMFLDATALTDLDQIRKWNTASAQSMRGMFASLPGSPPS